MPRRPRTPSYRHHRPSGQAVVTLDGRDIYLGRHGSAESHAEYDRLIAEWLAAGRRLTETARAPRDAPGPTEGPIVAELILAYVRHADAYYWKGGVPTSEAGLVRKALATVRWLFYVEIPAKSFGPSALKAVREVWIGEGRVRASINMSVGRVVRAFKWAVAEEMISPSVFRPSWRCRGFARDGPPPANPNRSDPYPWPTSRRSSRTSPGRLRR